MAGDGVIISYRDMRRLIGIMGIVHPLLLALGGRLIFGESLQNSMSHYYYTPMRDIFVSFSFSTGMFLLCYRGYDLHDRIVSVIAGTSAMIVAYFPTAPAGVTSPRQDVISHIHAFAAFLFLGALAYFCLVLFPKHGANALSIQKRRRNVVYRVSGVVIVAGLLFITAFISFDPLRRAIETYHPLFFVEASCFVAFGVAWLVKGEMLFAEARTP